MIVLDLIYVLALKIKLYENKHKMPQIMSLILSHYFGTIVFIRARRNGQLCEIPFMSLLILRFNEAIIKIVTGNWNRFGTVNLKS